MKHFLFIVALTTGLSGFSAAQPSIPDTTRTAIGDTVLKNAPVTTVTPDMESVEIVTPTVIRGLYEEGNSSAPRLNPRAVSFVEDYIDAYSKSLHSMKDWALPYFNMIDEVMVKNGLPRELKYLAVIESKLKSNAVSYAGAVGPWQFMRGTALRLGLKVNKYVDERTNYVKSTHAAARYLKELYSIYGDWLLVIAAYNAGPGNVQKAIARSGSRNFWDLQYFLPAETRKHVKKFIGTHYVFEGQGGLTTLTKAETKEHYGPNLYSMNRRLTSEEEQMARSQKISGKYQSVVIAKYVLMDITEFNRYNPDFDKVMATSQNGYDLHLPAGKMELFNSSKYSILQESVQLLLSSTTAVNEKNSAVIR